MDTIFYAEVDTSHFTFRGVGLTESHARDVVMAAWDWHVRNTRRQGQYIDPTYVGRDDANVIEMPIGQAFMDWSPVGKPRKARP